MANPIFFLGNTYFTYERNMFWATILYKYHRILEIKRDILRERKGKRVRETERWIEKRGKLTLICGIYREREGKEDKAVKMSEN